MSHQSVSRKNKFHSDNMHKQAMTVCQYLERMEERRMCPAKIINGELMVQLHGHWISEEEFDKLLPPPIVHSFSTDITNCDKTKAWML